MAELSRSTTVIASAPGSYVEWGAVIAGAVTAAALSFLLFTFGSAIGLSLTSPWPFAGASGTTLVIVATVFAVLVQVGSYAIGGYVAGRMRSAWPDSMEAERQFRDGAHGFLVWALGVVISVAVAGATLSTAARTTADIGSSVAGAIGATGAAGVAASARDNGQSGDPWAVNPVDYSIDLLFRPAEGAAGAAAPTGAAAQPLTGEQRAEAGRILARSVVQSDIPAGDRQYLARTVSMRTGMSPEDADKRVNDVVTQARSTAADTERKAREAADKARKTGIAAAFLTAATLLISAAAAAAGAACGGRHRDESTAASIFGASRLW